VAYLVLHEANPFDLNEMRDFLQISLPAYMIPASFVVLEALPLTPNGKVDRASLPRPESSPAESARQMDVPRDPLERQLVQVFQDLLGVQTIGIHDDFFNLGGHSLLAVQLFARIEKLTGQSLPLSSLYQAATVAAIAALLRQKSEPGPRPAMVPVQAEGTRPALFLVPAAAGTSLAFKKMSQKLGPDYPLYSFDPLGIRPGEAPQTRVEDMAALYVAELCRFQPEGPYFIGGICFGAHVALEMAHLLQKEHQQVALLIVLGAAAPASGPSWKFAPVKPARKTLLDQFRLVRKHLIQRDLLKTTTNIVQWHIRDKRRKLWALVDERGNLFQRLKKVHYKAQVNYIARPFQGRILMIQSQDEAENTDYRQKWQELALQGLDYIEIPATNHRSMLVHERGLEQSVEALKAALEHRLPPAS
jgi:aspartate racemase